MEDFRKADSPVQLYIFGDPMHLSASGNRLTAETVCREIEEKCTISSRILSTNDAHFRISAFYHDSAAALITDGKIVTPRRKNVLPASSTTIIFPITQSYCLKEAGITADQLTAVAFYDKPFLKFERLMETYLAYAPKGSSSFMKRAAALAQSKTFFAARDRQRPGQYLRRPDLFHHAPRFARRQRVLSFAFSRSGDHYF